MIDNNDAIVIEELVAADAESVVTIIDAVVIVIVNIDVIENTLVVIDVN